MSEKYSVCVLLLTCFTGGGNGVSGENHGPAVSYTIFLNISAVTLL
jgi:hypothetical protein